MVYIGLFLEPLMVSRRFLAAYLLTGIAASATSLWWNDLVVSAGASGAIFGMYGVFLDMLTTNLVSKSFRKAILTSILTCFRHQGLKTMSRWLSRLEWRFRSPRYPLISLEDPRLRQAAVPIPTSDLARAGSTIRFLEDTLHWVQARHGAAHGIAAPQIGIPQRIIIVEREGRDVPMVNPVITRESPESRPVWERGGTSTSSRNEVPARPGHGYGLGRPASVASASRPGRLGARETV